MQATVCHDCTGLNLSPTQVTDALGRVVLTVYDVFGQIQQAGRWGWARLVVAEFFGLASSLLPNFIEFVRRIDDKKCFQSINPHHVSHLLSAS